MFEDDLSINKLNFTEFNICYGDTNTTYETWEEVVV